MPADRIESDRRMARIVAAYDEHAALTEVERAGIVIARELLAALDEIEALRKRLEYTGQAG